MSSDTPKRGPGRPMKAVPKGLADELGEPGDTYQSVGAYLNRVARAAAMGLISVPQAELFGSLASKQMSRLEKDLKASEITELRAMVKSAQDLEARGLARETADRQHATTTVGKLQ